MTSIFLMDASNETDDLKSRQRIKNICASTRIPCSETSDEKYDIEVKDAEIIIVHLGYITDRDSSKIPEVLNNLRTINSIALIIAVSSSDSFLDKSREFRVPSFKYYDVIKILEEAVKLLTTNKSLRQSIEEIISGKASVGRILSLFLPLDIDLQAIARVTDRTGYWEALKPKEAKLNYSAIFNDFKTKVESLTIGNQCLIEFCNDAAGNMFKNIDDSKSQDELMNYQQPFHIWFCNLASCLHGKKICNDESEKL